VAVKLVVGWAVGCIALCSIVYCICRSDVCELCVCQSFFSIKNPTTTAAVAAATTTP